MEIEYVTYKGIARKKLRSIVNRKWFLKMLRLHENKSYIILDESEQMIAQQKPGKNKKNKVAIHM